MLERGSEGVNVRSRPYEGVTVGNPNRPPMDPELRSMLARHREELLRRALALAVSRSPLEELAERPLGDRLEDLELLFEAASGSGYRDDDPRSRRPLDLQTELEEQVAEHGRDGRPFSVAVIATGPARIGRLDPAGEAPRTGPTGREWGQALRDMAAETDIVIDAGDGATAVILPDHDGREARMASERLCRSAWRLLGEQGPLAAAGIATYPDDASSGYEVLAAAYDALWRQAEFEVAPRAQAPEAAETEIPEEDERPPAPVHPLRPL